MEFQSLQFATLEKKNAKQFWKPGEKNWDADRKTENEETNNKLLEFFNECCAQKILVTRAMLQETTLKITNKLGWKNFGK